MKKFLIKIAGFSIFFLLVNVLYLFLCMSFTWNFKKRIELKNMKDPSYEVIILGNSLALDGIDSEALSNNEREVYNLAMGGASVRTNYIQLSEYLQLSSTPPETVILGMGTYLNNFLDNSIHPIVDFTMSDKRYGIKDLPMAKFKWLAVELLKKVVSSEHRNAVAVKGQLRISRIVPDHSSIPAARQEIEKSKYEESHYINEIAILCIENNIRFVLVEMPGFNQTKNSSPIGPISLSFKEIENVPLYNFNSIDFSSNLDSNQDWLGNSHLNQYGAKKFTGHLAEAIL